MERFIKRFIFPIFIIFTLQTHAQELMTTYPMNFIPQAYYENPGQLPPYKLHIGCLPILFVPVLSSNFTSLSNSGFRYSNLVHQRKDNDSLYLDPEDVVDGLAKKNHLIFNQQFEILSFGFKVKRWHYVSLSYSEKFKFRFTYPGDLLSMALKGNAQFIGSTANFDGLGLDFLQYREIALGYTYKINTNLTVGLRGKLLFGLGNIWTKSSKVRLAVDEQYYDLTATSNLEIFSSLPPEIYNMIDGDSTADRDFTSNDISRYFTSFKNPGFGLDIGATYNINKKWTVGASINDFGYIFWKNSTRKYSMKDKSFTFRGIDITDFIRPDTSNQDPFEKLLDSIADIFELKKENVKYASPLNPKIYISAYYHISEKDKLATIFRGEIYENALHPSFTIAYNRHFGNILDFTLSYSYMNRDFVNLGLGTSLRFGPFQIFLATDNLLAPIIPYYSKNFNIHFGCNYVFYKKLNYPLMSPYK